MRIFSSCCVLALACASPKVAEKPAEPAAQAPAPKPMPPGLDEAAMDLTADPCADFYQYACGNWLAKTEIPADKSNYARSFTSIFERNEKTLKEILDQAAESKLPAETPFVKQLSDFYGSCMDEAAIEKSQPKIAEWAAKLKFKTPKDIAQSVATLHKVGANPLFDIEAIQDLKVSTEVIAGLDQNGLGLPDRDYYVDEDAKKKAVRAAYAAYVAKMFELWGEKPAAAQKASEQVMTLETRLAKVSQTKVERRDPNKLYHRVERDGLKKEAPVFAWDAYFDALGGASFIKINVNSVEYFRELSKMAKDVKPDAWKTYFTWVVIRNAVQALPKKFQDENFAYVSKNLTGAKEDRPRWKKCVAFTDQELGEALGREFVRRTFGEDGKQRTLAMVKQLQTAMQANLKTLKWMDEPTRQMALKKLERMVEHNKIGYPDTWRDYSSVATRRDSFFESVLETNRFEGQRQLAKIGKPVDRNEWLMSPPAVNAYNEGQKNEIVFPAGILQPPFFDRAATDAVNFGAIGVVVGHEITHGFDDEGRQFDVDGNLKDWWSEASGKAFVERAQCVKQQYDDYIALEDIHVKGDLTLGENVADLGGVKISHSAMLDWYAKKGAADGYRYDPSQQFFLGFAQAWCAKLRPETARLRAATDPHSPPRLRVLGPLSNYEPFRVAFSCKADSPAIRPAEKRCEVW